MEINPFKLPEYSDWKCEIWPGTMLIVMKGKEPNWFWRKMQYLMLGFRWEKAKP
jgi:hypothetical protein